MDNYHLNKVDDHWQLIKEGASRATKTGATKEAAMQQAHDFLADKIASLKKSIAQMEKFKRREPIRGATIRGKPRVRLAKNGKKYS